MADQPGGRPGQSSSPIPSNPLYGRFAGLFGAIADRFEGRAVDVALRLLDTEPGDAILEVGPGTGRALARIADQVGAAGRAVGLEPSERMRAIATRRLARLGLADRAIVVDGDVRRIPFDDGTFDAAFAAFVLETLSGPSMEVALAEVRRVLRPGGVLVVVVIAARGDGLAGRLYRIGHERWPGVLDCAPINAGQRLRTAGFQVKERLLLDLWGVPVDAVRAVSP